MRLQGGRLDVGDVVSTGPGAVAIDDDAYEKMQRSFETAVRVARRRTVYGRTTGVGANRDVTVAEGDEPDLRLLRSHATGSGEWLSRSIVRAALAIRLNQLLAGGSGMHPGIADAIAAALRDDELPRVRAHGSIGTGDLSNFAEIGLGLAGLAPLDSGRVRALWAPRPGDALAFISTNAMTVAMGCMATEAAERWLDHGLAVACLSLIAARGSAEAIAAPVHEARPHSGQGDVAARMRLFLQGHEWTAARVQDSYGFRAVAQVQGAVAHAVRVQRDVLNTEINAASENPFISAAADDVFHHGNFHTLELALALDHTKLAVASSAQLALSRLANLSDPAMTGLDAFLAQGPPGSSGIMLVEYNASAALARLRSAAMPATLGTTVISRGTEDHASFAPQSVRQLDDCVREATAVTACELQAAVRALRQMGESIDPATSVGAYFHRAADRLNPAMADRPLGDDLEAAVEFLQAPATSR